MTALWSVEWTFVVDGCEDPPHRRVELVEAAFGTVPSLPPPGASYWAGESDGGGRFDVVRVEFFAFESTPRVTIELRR